MNNSNNKKLKRNSENEKKNSLKYTKIVVQTLQIKQPRKTEAKEQKKRLPSCVYQRDDEERESGGSRVCGKRFFSD